MRKSLIAAALIALTVFGIGYVIGQVRGATATSAATTSTSPLAFGRFGASPGGGAMPKHADGTVTAVNGNTVTVQADNDADNANEYSSVTTIQLTGRTQYNIPGGKSGITVGSRVVAEGTVSSDGKTLTATQVSTCPGGGPGNGGTPGAFSQDSGTSSPGA